MGMTQNKRDIDRKLEDKQFRKKLRRIQESISRFQINEKVNKEEYYLLQKAIDSIETVLKEYGKE